MNARATAARVLLRIRDEGAYSNVVLPHATATLREADRAFVYHLVYQSLRRLRHCDAIIEEASNRRLTALDPEVRAVLEIAVAEMLGNGTSAVYATVDESVNAIRQLGRPQAAGLVNAVLRSLAREGFPVPPPGLAKELSLPDWVVETISTDHGAAEAAVLLEGLRSDSGGVSLRIRPGFVAPPDVDPVPAIPGAYSSAGRPASSDGLVFADAASTAVGLAVAPAPGQVVLDMAAAPGGKTLHLWDQMGGAGVLVAMDVHQRRLRSARRRLRRLGAFPSWLVGDATHAPFATATFDRVLLDAPCTGLGTLRRRPEIAMRLAPGADRKMANRQATMLAEAWRMTKPGGKIIYSVCTLFAAETVEVVAPYETYPPSHLPGRKWGGGLLLAPHLTATDGMFVAVIPR
jgi:16S rRNA (cytosine967-C5)-methyltransferase